MRELIPGVFSHQLPSGLSLLVEPMPGANSVALGIWFRAGGRDDPADKCGLAHLVEHMCFKGTLGRSALEIAQAIDALGGNLNGATGREHTFYYTTVLGEGLETALEVLGEMVTQPQLAPADLERERTVVLEEIRGAEDDPQDFAFQLLVGQLWGRDHPLGRPIPGRTEDVGNLRVEDLRAFFHRHYRPAQAVLTASGRVAPGQLVPHAQRIWPAGSDGEVPQRHPPRPAAGLALGERDVQQVHLALAFPTVPADSPSRYGMEVLSTLLGGGVSSRLFQRVREERGLAYAVSSATSHHTDCGTLLVYAATEERHLAEVLDIVRGELAQLGRTPPAADDLDRAKRRLRAGFLLSLEEPAGRMFRLGHAAALGLEILPVAEVERRLEAVSGDQVQELAARFLDPRRAAVAMVGRNAERLERVGALAATP